MGKGFNFGGIGSLFGGDNNILFFLVIFLLSFNEGSRK
jgi:hypothetical protein